MSDYEDNVYSQEDEYYQYQYDHSYEPTQVNYDDSPQDNYSYNYSDKKKVSDKSIAYKKEAYSNKSKENQPKNALGKIIIFAIIISPFIGLFCLGLLGYLIDSKEDREREMHYHRCLERMRNVSHPSIRCSGYR